MINNKQVNIWRGDEEPPTLFHVWIYQNEKILLHNGEEWVVFINDRELTNKIIKLQEDLNNLEKEVNKISKSTVNNKLIIDNPVLNGHDLKLGENGEFVNSENSISDNVLKLDNMFVTQIIG